MANHDSSNPLFGGCCGKHIGTKVEGITWSTQKYIDACVEPFEVVYGHVEGNKNRQQDHVACLIWLSNRSQVTAAFSRVSFGRYLVAGFMDLCE